MRYILLFLLCVNVAAHAGALPHHQLRVTLDPVLHTLTAEDRLTLPDDAPRTVYFWLHHDLHPLADETDIVATQATSERLQQYRATLPQGQSQLTLRYAGEIYHPQQQDVREDRAFENSPGMISADGVVLSGSSGWYPQFSGELGERLATFSLTVSLPAGWQAVSQGVRTVVDDGQVNWTEIQPQDEIYLIAAAFTRYAQRGSGVEAEVYLRRPDAALAQRYLDATERYLMRYENLFGAYPYAKFALLENFWESGYGMPSFTLLGGSIIRLPFIIDTSFPHEILHNWWGNGVYVDYHGGNWSEGLTAYLADHLLQENRGEAAAYRRGMLQKYSDYVSRERDFPLTQFTSRHSAQSEAVGYGKAMMVFHMLRREIGDAAFVRGLRDFYANHRFRRASFEDLRQSFSAAANRNLAAFFNQWVRRSGAPQLRLVSANNTRRADGGYDLAVVLEQTQPGAAYRLNVPLAVTLADENAAATMTLEMNDKRLETTLSLTAQPLRVDVDPEFDLFRRLDNSETPAAFSRVFGAQQLLIVLPHQASAGLREAYQALATTWQQQPARATTIVWDEALTQLPNEGAVWLFGRENRWYGRFQQSVQQAPLLIPEYGNKANAAAVTTYIDGLPTAWLAAPDALSVAGAGRKLPHYAKYSYTLFDAVTLRNLDKGLWPVARSTMAALVQQPGGRVSDVNRAALPPRDSLAR
ncbi:MAG: M1 family metallopeptidase [Pseudomonadota bacterium]